MVRSMKMKSTPNKKKMITTKKIKVSWRMMIRSRPMMKMTKNLRTKFKENDQRKSLKQRSKIMMKIMEKKLLTRKQLPTL